MTALAVVASGALGLAMWGMTVAVQSVPRVGVLLPAPAWPWATRGTSLVSALGAIATAAIAVFAVVDHTWSLQQLPLLLLVVLGLPAAYTDARELRLPNALTYGLAAAAAATVIVLDLAGSAGNAAQALLGGAAYALLLLAVAVLTPTGRVNPAESGVVTAAPTALGLGDVKLAVGTGIALGWTSIETVLFGIALMSLCHLGWSSACAARATFASTRRMTGSALGPFIILSSVAATVLR